MLAAGRRAVPGEWMLRLVDPAVSDALVGTLRPACAAHAAIALLGRWVVVPCGIPNLLFSF